jgi:hypothetical protein
MCTVSVVPHGTGVRVVCNRDERRTRPAALPPALNHLGGTRAFFPIDPEGGGTWIGVNDAGLVVTLLNAHPTNAAGSRQQAVGRSDTRNRDRREGVERSRGLIVRELLGCASFAQAIAAAAETDARTFAPFRLVILQSRSVAVVTSDGGVSLIRTQAHLNEPLLFTSSSLGDAVVELPRRRLFERIVLSRRAGWLSGQSRFHRHRWPSRPEISVRMERPDAMTVSRTAIELADDGVRLLYEAPPCGRDRQDVLECCFSR